MKSSAGGRYYFKMIPHTPYDRKKGSGILYAVRSKGADKILWRVKGWYASRVYISYNGLYLVRLGNWQRGHAPSHKHIGIAFYKKGKLMRKYSTKDLIKNFSAVQPSVSHYQFLKQVIGFESGFSYRFKIRTIDNIEYTFNVSTGEIINEKKIG